MGPLAAAEQLWKQGDHEGAWLAIEELQATERVMSVVIDLRLRILTCLCKWDLGDNLASVLRFASEEGDIDGAKEWESWSRRYGWRYWPMWRGTYLVEKYLRFVSEKIMESLLTEKKGYEITQ